jgi:PhzF family phenazine biosynthesis protein
MIIPYFEVLAFTDRPFTGNPAGVCLLADEWLPEALMQQIAAENNLAETAFLIERKDYFDLRWFTPAIEIDLCGHATLASAHVLFYHRGWKGDSIRFQSQSGELRVDRIDNRLVLDFPAQPLSQCEPPAKLTEGLRAKPREVLRGRDYFAVFDREEDVRAINPDLQIIAELDAQGVIVTAPGNDCDFVSRYFAPAAGIPEDPVTGSAHCVLIPYWSKRLGKRELYARQISKRGGELFCEDRGERVGIGGNAITYVEGKLHAG